MSRFRQFVVIALCAAVGAGSLLPTFIRAAGPTTTPATRPARTMAALEADLNATMSKLNELLPYPKVLSEAKFRKENAETVIPLLRKMAGLLDELATTQNIPMAGRKRIQCLSMAVAMGDKESAKLLDQVAAGKNEEEALDAKVGLVLGNWVNASEDAKAQQKILDEFAASAKDAVKAVTDLTAEREAAKAGNAPDAAAQKKAAERDAAIEKANAKQDNIADTLMIMSQLGPANDDMAKKALAVIKTLNSEGAKQAAARADADQAQRNLVGRPIKIAGRTTAGGDALFSIAQWRGKVVLVDFWATWCGPCRASLPHVKKLYEDYHAKGLEIVGVDCDSSDEVVNAFTKAKENAMPWPQLREASQTEDDNWHPLAKRYGVDAIPAMFLIDKKGVLRYIDGDDDTEAKVKKLLEEPGANPPAKTPAEPAKAPAK